VRTSEEMERCSPEGEPSLKSKFHMNFKYMRLKIYVKEIGINLFVLLSNNFSYSSAQWPVLNSNSEQSGDN
jgi:hypothetical protein